MLYFFWRQPRIGTEKFYGGILTHDGRGENRVYQEISQIGEEIKRLSPAMQGTKVAAGACILYSHENEWALALPRQPNEFFSLRDHVQLFHSALHDRNIPVDFARPSDDLSRYKMVFAPSLSLLAGGEADALKLYVQNGGTLVATCNSGLVDEHHIAADTGFPHDLTDLFGLEVLEFDPMEPGDENHLAFKGSFHTSHLHTARLWCDIIEPHGCQVLATFAKDFYAGRPAITINNSAWAGRLHRHDVGANFLLRPRHLAAKHLRPGPTAQSARHGGSEHAGERRSQDLFPAQPSGLARAHPVLQADARLSDGPHL